MAGGLALLVVGLVLASPAWARWATLAAGGLLLLWAFTRQVTRGLGTGALDVRSRAELDVEFEQLQGRTELAVENLIRRQAELEDSLNETRATVPLSEAEAKFWAASELASAYDHMWSQLQRIITAADQAVRARALLPEVEELQQIYAEHEARDRLPVPPPDQRSPMYLQPMEKFNDVYGPRVAQLKMRLAEFVDVRFFGSPPGGWMTWERARPNAGMPLNGETKEEARQRNETERKKAEVSGIAGSLANAREALLQMTDFAAVVAQIELPERPDPRLKLRDVEISNAEQGSTEDREG